MTEHLTHEQLVEITRREVQAYANYYSFTGELRFLADDTGKQYAVVFIPNLPRPHSSRVVILAQVVGEKVIIIEDTTDKPLYEELMRCGIPREQIILRYAGEKLPKPEPENPS